MFPLTILRLLSVMPRAGDTRAVAWTGVLNQAMAAFGITTPPRVQMFLANLAHESAELTKLEEDLRYSPKRLRQVFPRFFPDDAIAERYAKAGPEAIANRVYGNRLGNGPETSGDGWAYRGRAIGLTFKANYMECSIAICGDADTLLKNPEFVADPEFGAAASAWYWAAHGCNELADAGDFDGVCDAINIGRKTIAQGDSNGFADRLAYFEKTQRLA